MDEILKRLNEIKAEAKALPADDPARKETLAALAAESIELQSKLADHKAEAEAIAAIDGAPDEAPAEDEGGEDESEDAGDGEDAPAEEDAGEEAPAEEEAPEAIAAAANAAKPVDTDISATGSGPEPTVLVASGNVGGTNPGDKLDLRSIDRIHRHAGKSGMGGAPVRSIFASISVRDGDIASERNTAEQNTAIMASASGKKIQPITAAAAFCGPNDIVLDINAAGTAARPVAALFNSVPVRGPFDYMKTATLADVSPGVNIWEEQDQIDLETDDPDSWKPDVDLSCRTPTTVTPYAIVASTTIGVWQQLSAPEQVANWLAQMEKQYSRVAETKLLDQIRAQSYVYSHSDELGLWSTIQPLLANTAQIVAEVNRGTTEGYTLVVPYGTLDVMAADEVMRGFSQNLAKARIRALLKENYGIDIVESLETDSTKAAAFRTGAIDLGTKTLGTSTAFTPGDASATTIPMYLLRTDAFVMGQSDVVDAGYHRDANMVRQNLVRYFYEGMEFLEKTGDHLSFVYDVDACPTGKATALVDGPDCQPVED